MLFRSLFPDGEVSQAGAAILVLHFQVGQGGIEGQFDGIGEPGAHVRQRGALKHRREFLAPSKSTCYGEEEG